LGKRPVSALSIVDPTLATNSPEAMAAALAHIESAATGFQVPQVLESALGDPGVIYDGEFWRIRSPLEKAAEIRVPTFVIGGAHCIFSAASRCSTRRSKGTFPQSC